MTYDKIRDKIDAKEYDNKMEYPKFAKFKDGHIFDENQTVVWNREKVKEENDKMLKLKQEYQAESNRLARMFDDDVTEYISKNCGISSEKAKRIFDKAYSDGHSSGYHNVLVHADELCDLIIDILA